MARRPRPKLLIPVVFPEPALYPLTNAYIEGLDGFDIILFGYWEISEQQTVETARDAHRTEAEAVLYEMAAQFSHAGAATNIQLHFGPSGAEGRELQNRIVDETDPDGVLFADQLTSWKNVLVPLRDDRHQAQIIDFVSAFHTESIFILELYHATPDDTGVEAVERMLKSVEETLLTRGFSEADLEITVEVTEDVVSAIAAKARNHNIVVIGDTEASKTENQLFGRLSDHIDRETDTPIVVIRE